VLPEIHDEKWRWISEHASDSQWAASHAKPKRWWRLLPGYKKGRHAQAAESAQLRADLSKTLAELAVSMMLRSASSEELAGLEKDGQLQKWRDLGLTSLNVQVIALRKEDLA
jgi:hypothetical protein